ncbi:MAG TPA: PAS domain S-box protein [Nitrospirota bacterium]|nr:PAS domain S-box protein [Nitrospirota bacterium]
MHFSISSLRFRLLVLVLAALVPALGLLVYVASTERSNQESELRSDTMTTAVSFAGYLEQMAEGSRQALVALSELPAVRYHRTAECNVYFSALGRQLPMYNNLGAVDLNGNIFCSAVPLSGQVNVADRLYFRSVLETRAAAYGVYNIGRTNNRPVLASAFPVFEAKGRMAAVVFAALGLDWIRERLNGIPLPEKATLTIIDRDGTIIYRNPDNQAWIGKSIAGSGFSGLSLSGESSATEVPGLDGVKRIYASAAVKGTGKSIFVRVGMSAQKTFADINHQLARNLLVLLFIASLAAAIAWFGGEYFIMQRMNLLMKATEELSKGNLGTRVETSSVKDEISRLGNSFNSMAEALERRIAECRNSEQEYRSLFEESKDAIFVSTPQGRYLDINPAAVDMFGYSSREEMLRLDIRTDIFVNPEDRKRYEAELRKRGYVKDYELELKRKDGARITVLSTSTALCNANGDIIAYRGINHDITQRKKLEQQLLQAQKMEAVGQLSGGVAHDFNNILTAIMGYGNLISMKLAASDPLHEYAEQILASSQKAAELTQSLLAFSRKRVLNPEDVDINAIVLGMKGLLERVIGEDIKLTAVLSDHPLIIKVDKGQLEQALMNLATNARDAMPRGGRLEISTEEMHMDGAFIQNHHFGSPGTYAMMSVADSGTGMDKATQQRIFEPFFTTKEVGKGTGLGLAMVYGTVKQHDGFINVYSESGVGTTFFLYLPLMETAEAQSAAQPAAAVSSGSETILLVEDNGAVMQVMQTMLHKLGYSVIEASRGEGAIKLFREHADSVQLVITDMIMPGMNGKDMARALKKIRPGVKVLYISGYTADILKQKGMEDEKLHFLSKPIQLDVLSRKIRELLDNRNG